MSCCLETSFGTKASFFFFHALLCFHPGVSDSVSSCDSGLHAHCPLNTWGSPSGPFVGCKCANPQCAVPQRHELALLVYACSFRKEKHGHWRRGSGAFCRSSVSCLQKNATCPKVAFIPLNSQKERVLMNFIYLGTPKFNCAPVFIIMLFFFQSKRNIHNKEKKYKTEKEKLKIKGRNIYTLQKI